MLKLSRILPKIAKSRKFLPLKYSFTVFTLLLRIETTLRGKFLRGFPQEMWHKANIRENKSTREEKKKKKKGMNWS